MKTRIITINVAGTKDDWFDRRRDILVRGLASQNPDIICLQETTVSRGYSIYDQARDVGEAIGLPVVAFTPYGNPIEIMSHEQGGIAIASRWPIRRVRNRRLPAAHETPPDSRVALFVALDTPAGELKVVTTHLSWEPDGAQMRLMQMGLILDDLFQGQPLEPSSRIVLTGDFNALETEPAINLIRDCFIDTFRFENPDQHGHTWLTSNPLTGRFPIADRRLDYIFCPLGAKIHQAKVVLGKTDKGFASDHLGVLAEIEWPEKTNQSAA
jgi:endonuclease/exonuclease/phosphatase family metal-dependent hydrolase